MIYTSPGDNVAGSVTPVLQVGTVDAQNPLANLTNGDPAIPFFTTDSIGVRVTWDFTSTQRIDYVSIPMHGIPSGTLVLFQMHTADSWGTPDLSAAMTIDTFRGDFPRVQAKDLTGEGGYLVGGYRFASLLVPSHGGLTKIGDVELWTTKRELEFSLRFGVRVPRERRTHLHTRQDGGRFVYDRQIEERMIRGQVRHDAADFALLTALYDNAKGPVSPFLVNVAAAQEHMLVWWSSLFDPNLSDVGARDVPIEWTELGRGVPL